MAARVTGMAARSRRNGRRCRALVLARPPLSSAWAPAALAALLAAAAAPAAHGSAIGGSMALGPRFHAAETGRGSAREPAWTGSGDRWLSVAGLAGSTQPDPGLADYQWDVTPHLAWGMKAMAGSGRFGWGLRFWRSRTTQDLGVANEPDPAVTSTTVELIGSARLGSVAGIELSAFAGGGWLRLAWTPDQATLDTGAGTTEVRFTPVDEWIAGAGLGLRRGLAGPWSLGVEADHRRYALDTAHRAGAAIVEERTGFGEWSARMDVTWTRGW